MKLTPKIQKAISRASVLHLGQKRKGDGAPYILHPYSVAFILSHYTNDEDIIVAGLLHDVLEDVDGYEKEDLQKEFGERVANMVSDVTEDISLKEDKGEKESWVERKTKYLDHLDTVPPDSAMLSCADKIHNLSSMLEAYKEQGDELWEKFNSPSDKKLWYYEQVLKIVKEKVDSKIVDELEALCIKAKRLF